MPVIVDIYCRVSTDDQEDNTSLDEQEACAREYCRENGLIVSKVWKETYSGFYYRERKDLGEVRRRYQEGKIQGVVFRTLDRLSRKQEHVAILLEEMEYYDVEIHCVKEKIDDTPMGKIARMVLAFVAEMEREKILDRTTTGRINKAKEGKAPPVGKVPYGRRWVYNDKREHDHIELVEEQADVLRKAAGEYADGISLNSIVAKLNEDGIPSATNGIWHNGSLLRLLTDPRITGRNLKAFDCRWPSGRTHLGAVDLPDDTYPQIISVELYERVIARTEYNALSSPRKSAEPEMFLLRGGFARCKYCGNAMGTYIGRRPGRQNQYLYRCNTKGAECFHHAMNAIALDKEVWEMASLAADYQPLIEQSITLASKHDLAAIDLASVERAIKTCKGKIENYEGDLEDPTLRGDTRAGIRQLLNAQFELLETLETEKAKIFNHTVDIEKRKKVYDKLLEWCHKAKDEREKLSYTQKRDFLELLGMTVFVGKRPDRYHDLDWDAKLRLPELEALLHEANFCVSLSHEQA
ncbi:MAG TPA: recombinase family protein [Ktedonobacteraceae bacterium]